MIKKLPKSLTTVTPFSKFVALALFLVLPFVGFYLGMQYQQVADQTKESEIVNVIQPTPTPTISVLPTTDPSIIANWKTYTDTQYEFSLRYPEDWKAAKDILQNEKYKYIATDVAKFLNSAFFSSDQKHVVWIKIVSNPQNKSLEDIVKSGVLDKDYGTVSQFYEQKSLSFNSFQIGQHTVLSSRDWPSGRGAIASFIKNPSNNSYAWVNLEPFLGNTEDQNSQQIYYQILSTFKFLN